MIGWFFIFFINNLALVLDDSKSPEVNQGSRLECLVLTTVCLTGNACSKAFLYNAINASYAVSGQSNLNK